MANTLDSIQGIGVLAILGGALFLAWKYLFSPSDGQPSNPNEGWASGASAWLFGRETPPDPVAVPTYWCEQLGANIWTGLSCPRRAAAAATSPVLLPAPVVEPPGVLPNAKDIGDPWNDQVECLPGFEFLSGVGCIPAISTMGTLYSDKCMWPDGSLFTVPPGMDCRDALADMCDRFGSGYRGCP